MNIDHISDLLITAEAKSYNKAAESLNITAPGLKKRINHIETYFGQKIFVPSSKGLELTVRGKEIVDELEQIQSRMDALKKRQATIKVGVIANLPLERIKALKSHPALELIDMVNTKVQLEALQANEVDIIVAEQMDTSFNFTPWFKEDLTVICHKDHALSKQSQIDETMLAEQQIYLMDDVQKPEIDSGLKTTYASSREIIFNNIATSDSIAICPASYAEKINMNLYRQISIPGYERVIGMYVRTPKLNYVVDELI